ncbi:probable endochitinase [Daphnia pulicaria]|uniref:probable endochitinase n=1 Tax=Daphnia pulicaria TaxID=35523 RepID=UPI001EEACE83|nr:probable endochitinase [Daphnia pulicaria]
MQVKVAIKTLAFLGLFIFAAAENSLLVQHPFKAISPELSTDITSELTPTANWETSWASTDVDPSTISTDTRPSTVTIGPDICANESSDDYIFPNPEDCTTFYLCSNGTPYFYNCPSGLVYNDAINQCDYPYNVSPPCNI